ncbi:MAG: RIP metalloprotease RseP [SAR202 cluster bacterium]|nr:RIP metalloprotease RseP [SAR202 cluster bacterium]
MFETILVFAAVLGFLVIAHELGHFTVAKLAKVRVLEFGIGYPPKVLGFKRGETAYTINLLPLGGFVRMEGEDGPAESPRSFTSKPPLTRLAILAAGASINAILPVFLLTAFFMIPRDVVRTDVTIVNVSPDSPAAAAGLLPGDVVVEADGREVDNSADLLANIQRRMNADATWVVRRDGALTAVVVRPDGSRPAEQGAVGIGIADARVTVTDVAPGSPAAQLGLRPGDTFVLVGNTRVLRPEVPAEASAEAFATNPGASVPVTVFRDGDYVTLTLTPSIGPLAGFESAERPIAKESLPVWKAVPASLVFMGDILVMTRNEIGRWFSGAGEVQLSGPVGIAQLTGEVAQGGISPLLTWTALLSLNLAIINLLPIPALDGGRIVFVLIELARGGRRLAPEKERLVHLAGFVLLMALVAVITIGDIQRLLS